MWIQLLKDLETLVIYGITLAWDADWRHCEFHKYNLVLQIQV